MSAHSDNQFNEEEPRKTIGHTFEMLQPILVSLQYAASQQEVTIETLSKLRARLANTARSFNTSDASDSSYYKTETLVESLEALKNVFERVPVYALKAHQISRKMDDISRRSTQLDESVNHLVNAMRKQLSEIKRQQEEDKKHDERIRVLDRPNSKMKTVNLVPGQEIDQGVNKKKKKVKAKFAEIDSD